MEIHERKHKGTGSISNLPQHVQRRHFHSGERPFVCQGCQFGFYKKSDLTLHRKGCRGPQYKCQGCDKVFHFKRQLTEHSLWSATCGRISKVTRNDLNDKLSGALSRLFRLVVAPGGGALQPEVHDRDAKRGSPQHQQEQVCHRSQL